MQNTNLLTCAEKLNGVLKNIYSGDFSLIDLTDDEMKLLFIDGQPLLNHLCSSENLSEHIIEFIKQYNPVYLPDDYNWTPIDTLISNPMATKETLNTLIHRYDAVPSKSPFIRELSCGTNILSHFLQLNAQGRLSLKVETPEDDDDCEKEYIIIKKESDMLDSKPDDYKFKPISTLWKTHNKNNPDSFRFPLSSLVRISPEKCKWLVDNDLVVISSLDDFLSTCQDNCPLIEQSTELPQIQTLLKLITETRHIDLNVNTNNNSDPVNAGVSNASLSSHDLLPTLNTNNSPINSHNLSKTDNQTLPLSLFSYFTRHASPTTLSYLSSFVDKGPNSELVSYLLDILTSRHTQGENGKNCDSESSVFEDFDFESLFKLFSNVVDNDALYSNLRYINSRLDGIANVNDDNTLSTASRIASTNQNDPDNQPNRDNTTNAIELLRLIKNISIDSIASSIMTSIDLLKDSFHFHPSFPTTKWAISTFIKVGIIGRSQHCILHEHLKSYVNYHPFFSIFDPTFNDSFSNTVLHQSINKIVGIPHLDSTVLNDVGCSCHVCSHYKLTLSNGYELIREKTYRKTTKTYSNYSTVEAIPLRVSDNCANPTTRHPQSHTSDNYTSSLPYQDPYDTPFEDLVEEINTYEIQDVYTNNMYLFTSWICKELIFGHSVTDASVLDSIDISIDYLISSTIFTNLNQVACAVSLPLFKFVLCQLSSPENDTPISDLHNGIPPTLTPPIYYLIDNFPAIKFLRFANIPLFDLYFRYILSLRKHLTRLRTSLPSLSIMDVDIDDYIECLDNRIGYDVYNVNYADLFQSLYLFFRHHDISIEDILEERKNMNNMIDVGTKENHLNNIVYTLLHITNHVTYQIHLKLSDIGSTVHEKYLSFVTESNKAISSLMDSIKSFIVQNKKEAILFRLDELGMFQFSENTVNGINILIPSPNNDHYHIVHSQNKGSDNIHTGNEHTMGETRYPGLLISSQDYMKHLHVELSSFFYTSWFTHTLKNIFIHNISTVQPNVKPLIDVVGYCASIMFRASHRGYYMDGHNIESKIESIESMIIMARYLQYLSYSNCISKDQKTLCQDKSQSLIDHVYHFAVFRHRPEIILLLLNYGCVYNYRQSSLLDHFVHTNDVSITSSIYTETEKLIDYLPNTFDMSEIRNIIVKVPKIPLYYINDDISQSTSNSNNNNSNGSTLLHLLMSSTFQDDNDQDADVVIDSEDEEGLKYTWMIYDTVLHNILNLLLHY